MLGTLDLETYWATLWGAFATAVGPKVVTLMTIVGVGVVLIVIGSSAWTRRRSGAMGGAQAHHRLPWRLLACGLLAASALVVPPLLTIADGIINLLIHIYSGLDR